MKFITKYHQRAFDQAIDNLVTPEFMQLLSAYDTPNEAWDKCTNPMLLLNFLLALEAFLPVQEALVLFSPARFRVLLVSLARAGLAAAPTDEYRKYVPVLDHLQNWLRDGAPGQPFDYTCKTSCPANHKEQYWNAELPWYAAPVMRNLRPQIWCCNDFAKAVSIMAGTISFYRNLTVNTQYEAKCKDLMLVMCRVIRGHYNWYADINMPLHRVLESSRVSVEQKNLEKQLEGLVHMTA